ncbi:MAG TPA: hypothetical protein VF928_03230 [Usitatibacteraceae bacterium]
MVTNSQSGFDSGPLNWVRAEIEHSLGSARTHFDELGKDPADSKAVQYAALCMHQVTGALSMVNLGAAARLSEEIEKLVAAFAVAVPADAVQQLAAAKNATVSLSGYLDSLMAGQPDRPMILATVYIALNRARGANDAAATDLFSPDLSATVPLPDEAAPPLSAEQLAEAVRQARSLFQAGLLKLLRDKDLVTGARTMRDAVLAIEALLFNPMARSFWFTAAGFFEAVANDPAGAGAPAVQLLGKIDQQIKLLIAGNPHVPEKLFRDLLLVVGKTAARTEYIEAIREVYRLDELLAIPGAGQNQKAEPALVAAVNALCEQVQKQKDNLLAFTSRNSSALEPFAKQAELLAAMAQSLPNRELALLLQVLGAIGKHARKTGKLLSDVQAMEVATAMLFVESSLENYFKLTPEFARQATAVSTRLRSAMTGVELPVPDASANSLGDTMTLRAQTHLLIFQVGREVQINLNTIEAALDAFFRDPQKTAELAPLAQLFKQVQGALSMLELDEAAALSEKVAKHVAQFAGGTLPGNGDEAAAVADGVSALGIYVNGLQQNAADPRALLLPALIRFGLADKSARTRKTGKARAAVNVDRPAQGIEPDLGDHKAAMLPATPPAAPAPLPPAVSDVRPAQPVVAARVPTLDSTALHRAIHLAIDQALGTAPGADSGAAAGGQSTVQTPGEADELQRLRKLELELRAVIKARDQRIQALELVLAKLNASVNKAAAG